MAFTGIHPGEGIVGLVVNADVPPAQKPAYDFGLRFLTEAGIEAKWDSAVNPSNNGGRSARFILPYEGSNFIYFIPNKDKFTVSYTKHIADTANEELSKASLLQCIRDAASGTNWNFSRTCSDVGLANHDYGFLLLATVTIENFINDAKSLGTIDCFVSLYFKGIERQATDTTKPSN